MKKALAIILTLVFILTGCNTNKAKINELYIDNAEYSQENNFLYFYVKVKPNKFDELKIYFINEETYESNNYGDYWKMYENKLPEGKFTMSLDETPKAKYVLFVIVKGFDQQEYRSDCVSVDFTGEIALIDDCTIK